MMPIPVPKLTTVPRPSPLLMTMVARILRPRRLCWMRVVRVLKRWWLNMAIWSCKVLPLTGSYTERCIQDRRKDMLIFFLNIILFWNSSDLTDTGNWHWELSASTGRELFARRSIISFTCNRAKSLQFTEQFDLLPQMVPRTTITMLSQNSLFRCWCMQKKR